jgi:hypothetical protein
MSRIRSCAARTLAAASLALAAAAGAPALAHHSFAMFDFGKTVVLKGVVKEFQWTNPHVLIWVLADDPAGGPPQLWSAELTSPGNLKRMGWTKRTLNPGDRVEVQISPLRDGSHGGGFRQATLTATGQVLTAASAPAQGKSAKAP